MISMVRGLCYCVRVGSTGHHAYHKQAKILSYLCCPVYDKHGGLGLGGGSVAAQGRVAGGKGGREGEGGAGGAGEGEGAGAWGGS